MPEQRAAVNNQLSLADFITIQRKEGLVSVVDHGIQMTDDTESYLRSLQ